MVGPSPTAVSTRDKGVHVRWLVGAAGTSNSLPAQLESLITHFAAHDVPLLGAAFGGALPPLWSATFTAEAEKAPNGKYTLDALTLFDHARDAGSDADLMSLAAREALRMVVPSTLCVAEAPAAPSAPSESISILSPSSAHTPMPAPVRLPLGQSLVEGPAPSPSAHATLVEHAEATHPSLHESHNLLTASGMFQ